MENQEISEHIIKREKIRRITTLIAHIGLYFFAAIGLVLIVGYLAVLFHFTDVPGAVDLNDRYFANSQNKDNALSVPQVASGTVSFEELSLWCKLFAMKNDSPADAARILAAYHQVGSPALALHMVQSIAERVATGTPLQNAFAACDTEWMNTVLTPDDSALENSTTTPDAVSHYPWINTPEWATLARAITKDAPMINQVAAKTGVEPRLIAAQLIGEQLRLYNTERELYKSAFAPLNILGSETQFSLGVAGIKTETAIAVEKNLEDPSSDYYPGPAYAHLLDFTTSDHDTERYNRITDEHDHYYAYLYAALFVKEIEAQWAKAGYNISNRPEIISTLYNLGFAGSHPNADPHVGGTTITIDGTNYTFGSLGYEFYYSGELEDVIPYEIQK